MNSATALVLRESGLNRRNCKKSLRRYVEDVTCDCLFQNNNVCLPGEIRATFLMVFSCDWLLMASTHGDHNIHVTEVNGGKHVKSLQGHPRTPWCVTFHPTRRDVLASGCLGGQVRVWDLSGGSEKWAYDQYTIISSVSFHPRKQLLVIAASNKLFFWDWSQPAPFYSVSTMSPREKVRLVRFDPQGTYLYTAIVNNCVPEFVEHNADNKSSATQNRDTCHLRNLLESPSTDDVHMRLSDLNRRLDHLMAEVDVQRERLRSIGRRNSSHGPSYSAPDTQHCGSRNGDLDFLLTASRPNNPVREALMNESPAGVDVANDSPSVSDDQTVTRAPDEGLVVDESETMDYVPGDRLETASNTNDDQNSEQSHNGSFSTIDNDYASLASELRRMRSQISTDRLRQFADRSVGRFFGLRQNQQCESDYSTSPISQSLGDSTPAEETGVVERDESVVSTFELPNLPLAVGQPDVNTRDPLSGQQSDSRPCSSRKRQSSSGCEESSKRSRPRSSGSTESSKRYRPIECGPIVCEPTQPPNPPLAAHPRIIVDRSTIMHVDRNPVNSWTVHVQVQERNRNPSLNPMQLAVMRCPSCRYSYLQDYSSSANVVPPHQHLPVDSNSNEDFPSAIRQYSEPFNVAVMVRVHPVSNSNADSSPNALEPTEIRTSSQRLPRLSMRHLQPPTMLSFERRPPLREGVRAYGVVHEPSAQQRYDVSIFDTSQQASGALQHAINRAILGAFNNAMDSHGGSNSSRNQTHRLQYWAVSDIDRGCLPDIACSNTNVIVGHCRILNDSSLDISSDSDSLVTFIAGEQPSMEYSTVAVLSLRPENRGKILFSKNVGPSAVSVNISPEGGHILLGVGSHRLHWQLCTKQVVAQILRMSRNSCGKGVLTLVSSICHPSSTNRRTFMSVNAAKWLPQVGTGFVYGTSRGDLQMCKLLSCRNVEKTTKSRNYSLLTAGQFSFSNQRHIESDGTNGSSEDI